jgi:hypothetical protein
MTDKEKATLNDLVSILQGQKDMSEADKILAPIMTAHLDNYEFNISIEGWKIWWHFMKEKGRISNVSGGCSEMKENADGTYTLVGNWRGELDGKVVFEPISASYRIRDGKIVEIWTKPMNYTFFFPIMRYRVGVAIIFLYLLLWRRFFYKSTERTLVGEVG